MNLWMDCYAPLIGRILMGGYFLWHAVLLSINLEAAAVTGLNEVLLALLIVVQTLGGIAVILGFQTRVAALVLVVSVLFFGYMRADVNGLEGFSALLRDLGVLGGLLYLSAYGAGKWRLPSRR